MDNGTLNEIICSEGIILRTSPSALPSEEKIIRYLRQLRDSYPNLSIQAVMGSCPGFDDEDLLLARCMSRMGATSRPVDKRYSLWTLTKQ